MNNGLLKKALPHLVAVVVFLVVALVYNRPVLQGKVLQQSDVTQWKAMAQNSFQYKEKHGHFPLWTNGMFSGMPAYQIAMEPKNPVSPGILYFLFTLGLPKPVSFFFLACVCFYFLSQVLRVNPYIGIIGSLAFAYATYNVVIVGAGHDTKMQSIAFMPALIGSILLIYERRYWLGGVLTAIATTLLVGMNHPQIAYYTLLIAAFMSVSYAIRWLKQKQFTHLAISVGVVAVAALLGVLTNAVQLATTYGYAKESIRGGSALADSTTNSTKTGLSTDYALSYSFYKSEPLVMMVPNMYGGSTEPIEQKLDESKAVEALQSMPQELASQIGNVRLAYWGGIVESAGTSGPPYVGAIICFLTLLGFFVLDNKHKWWILAASLMAIFMSWGHYFEGFNTFLLKALPMYNKFRAPSMTLVIPTFLFCIMAVLTLQKILGDVQDQKNIALYKKGLYLTGGVFLVLLLIYFSSDFRSEFDRQLLSQVTAAPANVKDYVNSFLSGLRDDRKTLFFNSLLRSLFFIAVAAGVLWLFQKGRLSKLLAIGVIAVLAFIDVISVDAKYLNADHFQDELEAQNNFVPTEADKQISQDTSFYRVLDLRNGLGTLTYGANTAYFHKSVGGYHPAKLSIYQDLIEHQLMKFPASLPVYDMLNTKYIIQPDAAGKEVVYPNLESAGPAWFVKTLRYEATPAAVMTALSNFHPKDTAVLFSADQKAVPTPQWDSAASIRLVYNDNDDVLYQSNAMQPGFAVFSEVYYDKGWKAYIDNKEAPIVRTNYVLRGLSVPAGTHQIKFEFRPDSYYKSERLAQIASIVIWLGVLAAAFQLYRQRRKNIA